MLPEDLKVHPEDQDEILAGGSEHEWDKTLKDFVARSEVDSELGDADRIDRARSNEDQENSESSSHGEVLGDEMKDAVASSGA